MAIKRRFENTETYVREEPEPVANKFDPANDPFVGSGADKLGLHKDNALSVIKNLTYVGPVLPSHLSTQDLLNQLRLPDNQYDQTEIRYRNRITSPLTAIRAFCVMCKGGSPKAANLCAKMECPVWAFRLGQNSFYGRKG